MNIKPFVFLAFSNKESKYLNFLKTEESSLWKIFIQLNQQGLIDFQYKGSATTKDLFSAFNTYRKDISILHYGGHADSLYLDLENGPQSLAQFIQLLRALPRLQLVFLNGCSTCGMVEKILEIKEDLAVIATSVDIEDEKACKFAIRFYEAFKEENQTLEGAFELALSVLQGPDLENAKFRHSVERTAGVTDKSPIPWGVYGNVNFTKNLKLVYAQSDENFDPQTTLEINRLYKELDFQNQEIKKLDSEIFNQRKILDLLKNEEEDLLRSIKNNIDKISNEQKSLKAKVEEVLIKIRGLKRNKRNIEFDKDLIKALEQLDYEPQTQYLNSSLEKVISNAKMGAFVLQGNPESAIELLEKRFIRISGLHHEDRKVIAIDFSSVTRSFGSTDEIWKLVAGKLNTGSSVNEVSEKIYASYLSASEPQNFLLIFRNIWSGKADLTVRMIKDFWFSLRNAIPSLGSKSGKLFLLVIDKNCRLTEYENQIVSHKEEVYRKEFSTQILEDHLTFIVPVAVPFDATYIKTWKVEQNLPAQYLEDAVIERVFNGQKKYILPVIKSICDETRQDDFFEKNFQQYRFNLPEL